MTKEECQYAVRETERRRQIAKILTQLEHAMSKHAYCEMNAQLLQTAQAGREELDPMLRALNAFLPLTMEGLQIDAEIYAYYTVVCEYARAGNIFSQFEMLKFYNAHPSELATKEGKYLIDKLEKTDTADAHYLLGCCWNDGICVPIDQNAAVRSWVRAAGLGSEKAERALKEVYQRQVQEQSEV